MKRRPQDDDWHPRHDLLPSLVLTAVIPGGVFFIVMVLCDLFSD